MLASLALKDQEGEKVDTRQVALVLRISCLEKIEVVGFVFDMKCKIGDDGSHDHAPSARL